MNRTVKNLTTAFAGRRDASKLRADTQLRADIATYTSAADLRELNEILSRYTPEETAEIRRLVRGSAAV